MAEESPPTEPTPDTTPAPFYASSSRSRLDDSTAACRQFQRLGWCRYGYDCPYEHVTRDADRKYKTELCVFYFGSGSCKLGSRCRYAHGIAELRNDVHYKTKLCRYFACRRGPECHFAHGLHELNVYWHPRYKTRLCRHFERRGRCLFGAKCHFAHGREELRPVPRLDAAVCRKFLETGGCRYGEGCFFSHSVAGRHEELFSCPLDDAGYFEGGETADSSSQQRQASRTFHNSGQRPASCPEMQPPYLRREVHGRSHRA